METGTDEAATDPRGPGMGGEAHYLTWDEYSRITAIQPVQFTTRAVQGMGVNLLAVVQSALADQLPEWIRNEVYSWPKELLRAGADERKIHLGREHERRVIALLTAIEDQTAHMVQLLIELVGQLKVQAPRTQENPSAVTKENSRPSKR